jgi:hypothetical protein
MVGAENMTIWPRFYRVSKPMGPATKLKEAGWYWYRFEALGTHYIPVYCDVDNSGDWFIAEIFRPEEVQPLGYLGELPGAIVGWIGEVPSDEDQN